MPHTGETREGHPPPTQFHPFNRSVPSNSEIDPVTPESRIIRKKCCQRTSASPTESVAPFSKPWLETTDVPCTSPELTSYSSTTTGGPAEVVVPKCVLIQLTPVCILCEPHAEESQQFT